MKRLVPPLILAGLLAAACSSGTDSLAVIASAPGSIGVGQQRVLVAVTDQNSGEYLASPEADILATLRDRVGSPIGQYEGEFVWIVPEARGLYAFQTEIPGPGTFQLTLESDQLGDLGPVGLVAVEDPSVMGSGDEAPRSDTRTSADHEISEITSDPNPDPDFYRLSVAAAVESGPSVIIFATPAWCTSHACGPLLDQVKTLSLDFEELNFVHVEVYENLQAESFEDLILVPSVLDWGLPSEPWVFVTNADGVVTASFEGAASEAELRSAFAAVAG